MRLRILDAVMKTKAKKEKKYEIYRKIALWQKWRK